MDEELTRLRAQVEELGRLRQYVEELERKLRQRSSLSGISKVKIREITEKILASDANITFLPDSIERRIYENVLTSLVVILDEVIDSTRIQFMGHEVTFDFHPQGSSK